jgi:rubrerythrin
MSLRVPRAPRYLNTRVCERCSAEYDTSVDFVYGRPTIGTDGGFVVYGRIPRGVCPVCREPKHCETEQS